MALVPLLVCHGRFVDFCREKETVLGLVGYLFPPQHPLLIATARALIGDPLSSFRLLADDACCRLCDSLGDAEFTRLSVGQACMAFFYGVFGSLGGRRGCRQAISRAAVPTHPGAVEMVRGHGARGAGIHDKRAR